MLVLIFSALLFCIPTAEAAYSHLTETVTVGQGESVSPVKGKKKKNKKEASPNQSQEKSLTVAILLFIFLGFLGIHRFYLGYTVLGIIYLLTGAIFGIGWIVDLVLFIMGKLNPKGKSSYNE